MTTPVDLVPQLQAKLTALGDGRDKRSENEQITYRQSYDAIQKTISGLIDAPDQIARQQARLDEWLARRAAYLVKEQDILKQIKDAPDAHAIADARTRDKEIERQRHLGRSLDLLRDGLLIVAPNVMLGSLNIIDARIAELTDRRDRLQMQLDGHVQTAEQLLAVTV